MKYIYIEYIFIDVIYWDPAPTLRGIEHQCSLCGYCLPLLRRVSDASHVLCSARHHEDWTNEFYSFAWTALDPSVDILYNPFNRYVWESMWLSHTHTHTHTHTQRERIHILIFRLVGTVQNVEVYPFFLWGFWMKSFVLTKVAFHK